MKNGKVLRLIGDYLFQETVKRDLITESVANELDHKFNQLSTLIKCIDDYQKSQFKLYKLANDMNES